MTRPLFHLRAQLSLLSVLLSGCGVLLGTVKPVDEKSESVGYMDLGNLQSIHADRANWRSLDPKRTGDPDDPEHDTQASEVSDAIFQAPDTAATISINSACRARPRESDKDLRSVARLLFLGITRITYSNERDLAHQGLQALESTVQGNLNGEHVKVRSVVIRKENCLYDLIYLSAPKHFQKHEGLFNEFVASLRLR